MKPVLEYAKERFPRIDTIHFWTDGPTTQYRSKTNFFLFSISERFSVSSTWNLSGAGHGKNAADGIGGSIKRTADNLVGQGVDIPNARILYEKLTEGRQSDIKLFYVPEREVSDVSGEINVHQKLEVIPGTMKLHQVGIVERGKIWYRDYSCFCGYPCRCYNVKQHDFVGPPKDDSSVEKGIADNEKSGESGMRVVDMMNSWVILLYEFDGRPYPGKVLEVDEEREELTVSVMRQKGNNLFNWPETKDVLQYPSHAIISIISGPMKMKRHYSLTQADWQLYQDLL
jgi:hypothetical protein